MKKSQPFLYILEEFMKKYHLPLMPVIWGVTCLIISGLILIGLSGYFSAEKAIAAQFHKQQLGMVQLTASSLENFLIEVRQNLLLHALWSEIRDPSFIPIGLHKNNFGIRVLT